MLFVFLLMLLCFAIDKYSSTLFLQSYKKPESFLFLKNELKDKIKFYSSEKLIRKCPFLWCKSAGKIEIDMKFYRPHIVIFTNISREKIKIHIKQRYKKNVLDEKEFKEFNVMLNENETISTYNTIEHLSNYHELDFISSDILSKNNGCLFSSLFEDGRIEIIVFNGRDFIENNFDDLFKNYALKDFSRLQKKTDAFFNPIYNFAKATYSDQIRKLFRKNFSLNKEERIPKKIHFIWLKNKIVKRIDIETLRQIKTWVDLNDSFKFYFWSDFQNVYDVFNNEEAVNYFKDNIEKKAKFKGSSSICRLFDKNLTHSEVILKTYDSSYTNIGIKSDILRLLILYKHGGIYVDVNDTICLKNLSEFCNKYSLIL